jgi:hypothetical protein
MAKHPHMPLFKLCVCIVTLAVFLIVYGQFMINMASGACSGETCGSAQRVLVIDEEEDALLRVDTAPAASSFAASARSNEEVPSGSSFAATAQTSQRSTASRSDDIFQRTSEVERRMPKHLMREQEDAETQEQKENDLPQGTRTNLELVNKTVKVRQRSIPKTASSLFQFIAKCGIYLTFFLFKVKDVGSRRAKHFWTESPSTGFPPPPDRPSEQTQQLMRWFKRMSAVSDDSLTRADKSPLVRGAREYLFPCSRDEFTPSQTLVRESEAEADEAAATEATVDGTGTITFAEETLCRSLGIASVEGTFVKGRLTGPASVWFTDGSFMRASFKEGVQHGMARTFWCKNGACDYFEDPKLKEPKYIKEVCKQ